MLRFAWALVTCVSFVVACSSTEQTQDASMPMPMEDAAAQGPCGAGGSKCGEVCTNLKRDPENCGACGKQCKLGEVCVQGGCALQCGGGSTKCAGTCVDTKSDPSNCGNCGTKCAAGQVCDMGKCAATCQMGLTDCSGACVDLQTDHDHCGMCGSPCPDGQRCTNGKCDATCQQGWSVCPAADGGTRCADLLSDPENCGSCGNACQQGYFCKAPGDGGPPTCQIGCFGGTTLCSNKCVDTNLDPSNCGGCGSTCSGNNICSNGHCCAKGEAWCGSCKPVIQCCNLVGKVNNQSFCKVAVNGVMNDNNIRAACLAAGLNVGCQAQGNCQYNDNLCVATQESSCGSPMLGLAKALGCGSPSNCNALDGVYQYMGNKWVNGSACGVEGGSWCSQGNSYSNRWGLCTP